MVRGRLTPDLVELARQHKADLLALLQESRGGAARLAGASVMQLPARQAVTAGGGICQTLPGTAALEREREGMDGRGRHNRPLPPEQAKDKGRGRTSSDTVRAGHWRPALSASRHGRPAHRDEVMKAGPSR